ncbi:MAG: hypothetical protein HYV07_10205 [Deltaproteobacteria bacterium]|nr:hypothetical protein [Deltaproteobacteria bacterium]
MRSRHCALPIAWAIAVQACSASYDQFVPLPTSPESASTLVIVTRSGEGSEARAYQADAAPPVIGPLEAAAVMYFREPLALIESSRQESPCMIPGPLSSFSFDPSSSAVFVSVEEDAITWALDVLRGGASCGLPCRRFQAGAPFPLTMERPTPFLAVAVARLDSGAALVALSDGRFLRVDRDGRSEVLKGDCRGPSDTTLPFAVGGNEFLLGRIGAIDRVSVDESSLGCSVLETHTASTSSEFFSLKGSIDPFEIFGVTRSGELHRMDERRVLGRVDSYSGATGGALEWIEAGRVAVTVRGDSVYFYDQATGRSRPSKVQTRLGPSNDGIRSLATVPELGLVAIDEIGGVFRFLDGEFVDLPAAPLRHSSVVEALGTSLVVVFSGSSIAEFIPANGTWCDEVTGVSGDSTHRPQLIMMDLDALLIADAVYPDAGKYAGSVWVRFE